MRASSSSRESLNTLSGGGQSFASYTLVPVPACEAMARQSGQHRLGRFQTDTVKAPAMAAWARAQSVPQSITA